MNTINQAQDEPLLAIAAGQPASFTAPQRTSEKIESVALSRN
ncbi:hypothetical protein [Actinomadura sp. WMMA1423]|nr:hypothetical protein [Actinomadura sp. WMMA1423]